MSNQHQVDTPDIRPAFHQQPRFASHPGKHVKPGRSVRLSCTWQQTNTGGFPNSSFARSFLVHMLLVNTFLAWWLSVPCLSLAAMSSWINFCYRSSPLSLHLHFLSLHYLLVAIKKGYPKSFQKYLHCNVIMIKHEHVHYNVMIKKSYRFESKLKALTIRYGVSSQSLPCWWTLDAYNFLK